MMSSTRYSGKTTISPFPHREQRRVWRWSSQPWRHSMYLTFLAASHSHKSTFPNLTIGGSLTGR